MGTHDELPRQRRRQPADFVDKAGFASELDALLTASPLSLRELARRTDTRPSTISSWRKARHLPYPRQDPVVAGLLSELGVEDTAAWLEGLSAARAKTAPTIKTNPYRGLEPFTEEHHQIFFGREELVEELWGRVRRHLQGAADGPIVLVGASGSGKTSALRAGLVVASTLNDINVYYVGAEPRLRLDLPLSHGTPSGDGAPVILIVDQFETVLADSPVVSSQAVQDLADRADKGAVVVIGLRADHYHLGLEHEYLAIGLRQPIVPDVMTDDRIADAIELPAQAANLVVEPGLTRQLLVDFGAQVREGRVGEVLPLLSHVLYKIVDKPEGRLSRELTLDRYRAVGGLDGALRSSVEDLYESLDNGAREICRNLFATLVEVGRDGLPLRRRARIADIWKAATARDELSATEKVVESFVEQRLLTVERETLTISHEALLRAWPRLADWIDRHRESLAALRRIRSAHEAWLANDRDPGSLLAGAELEIAERLRNDPVFSGPLGDDGHAFVDAGSHASAIQRRNRRLAFQAVAVTAVIAAVLAGVAFVSVARAQRSNAESVSRQLALQSATLAESEPGLSAQLAVAALSVASTVESRSAVIAASGQMAGERYLGEPGPTGLGIARNGDRIVHSDSANGRIIVLDRGPDGYREVASLTLEDPEVDIYGLDISPDGGLVAFGGTDLYANIWDIDADRWEILDDSLTNFQGPVQSIAFSSDGSQVIASGTSDGGVGRWDVAPGPSQDTHPLVLAEGSVMSIATDAAMTLMATGNDRGDVRLWSLADPTEPLWSHAIDGSRSALAVALNSDGDLLGAGFRDGSFEIWDISDPEAPEVVNLEAGQFGSWTTSLAFSPSGNRFVAASSDGQAIVWDVPTWSSIGAPLMHPNGVTNAEFIDDDTLVVALADGSVRVWDLDHPYMTSLGAPIWSAAFSPDGTRLMATSSERSALWRISAEGDLELEAANLVSPSPDYGFTGENRFSPDGQFVAAGTFQGGVMIMELTEDRAFEAVTVLEGLESLVEAVEFFPDGSFIAAAGSRGELALWELDSSPPTAAPTDRIEVGVVILNLAIDPSGSLVGATDSEGQLSLYSTASGGTLSELSVTRVADDSASGIAFHPTEPVVAVGSHDTTVGLWDVRDPGTPRLISRLSGPNGRIHDVGFDARGGTLAASTSDGTAWVWDVTNRADPEVVARLVTGGQMYTVNFSPTDDRLVGAGTDERITAWTLSEADAIESLCANLGQPVTASEWLALVPGVDYDPPC